MMTYNLPKSTAPDLDTAVLPETSARLRMMLDLQKVSEHDAPPLHKTHELIFLIRGMSEHFSLVENTSLIIGRSDPNSDQHIDVDLLHYGGMLRGISRLHAQINLLGGGRLFITDLDSTNGTYLRGQRMEPFIPQPLRRGDELVLGRLPVQILIN
ncbi:MAG: FHA domain-containing protein [Aggregatilineales bacterium]